MTVKIVSYNIQYGVGQDGRYDPARLLAPLADQDIVCLQEVTTNWRACNFDALPDLIAAGLNRYAVFAPAYEVDSSCIGPDGTIVNARRGFGNMVLSRWPILYSRPHSLPRIPCDVPPAFHPNIDFPRVALETVIDCAGTVLRVFSIHLSHLPGQQREAQIDALKGLVAGLPSEAALWPDDQGVAAWSDERPAPPVPQATLLLGDFNFTAVNSDYARMLAPIADGQTCLLDGWTASRERGEDDRTCSEPDGTKLRLDYMFATDGLAAKITSARVDQSVTASDHFPLNFTLDL